MMLNELLESNSSITIENLQLAYEKVVRKIRLHQTLIPICFNKAFIVPNMGDKNNYWKIISSGSEVAIKEIVDLFNKEYIEAPIYEDPKPVEVGNREIDYGFNTDRFKAFNSNHKQSIQIYRSGDYIASNVSEGESFLLSSGYIYPYLVYTSNGPYMDRHLYSIQDMVNRYGADGLTVDSTLMMMVIPQAIAEYHNSNGDVGYASNYETYSKKLINLYNRNLEMLTPDNWSNAMNLKKRDIR